MIIGLSGKKQSGKDTTGKIINILANSPHLNNVGVLEYLRKNVLTETNWQIKKFADKLKDIVCLLIGCTREQLEDETFKNTVLGDEWTKYSVQEFFYKKYFNSYEEAESYIESREINVSSFKDQRPMGVQMTPRLMMQLMGTECGRDIIHPNIWVNSAMSDYKPTFVPNDKYWRIGYGWALVGTREFIEVPQEDLEPLYPNWIFTDMRFPNESNAVDVKDGITIRVERPWFYTLLEDGRHEFSDQEDRQGKVYRINAKYTKKQAEKIVIADVREIKHISETALDDALFDYTIVNNGTVEDLINKVREILIKEKIIDEQKGN